MTETPDNTTSGPKLVTLPQKNEIAAVGDNIRRHIDDLIENKRPSRKFVAPLFLPMSAKASPNRKRLSFALNESL